MPIVAFIIYDQKAQKITYEQVHATGRAKWIDDYRIELMYIPGIMMEDGAGLPTYWIDVRDGSRRQIGDDEPIPN